MVTNYSYQFSLFPKKVGNGEFELEDGFVVVRFIARSQVTNGAMKSNLKEAVFLPYY